MFAELETYFTLFGGGTGIIAACGQLVAKDKRKENYNLAALWLTLALLMFQCASVFTGFSRSHPWVLCYHLTLIWLQAPLLYLAYFFLVSTEDKYPEKIYIFFIPSLLAFVLDSASIIAYLAGLIPNMLWIFHDENVSWIAVKKYLLIVGAVQIIVSLIAFIIRMLPAWNLSERNNVLSITIGYSIASIFATSFLLAGYITINVSYLKIASLICSAQIILISLIGQRFPKFFQMLQTEVKKERYKKSLLVGRDVAPILNQMIELMESDFLYRDETLTLKTLADRLSVNPHQLSQLLNDKMNTNFSNFVNRYRITEAEKILLEKPDRPVLAIAFDVGFNNKTSFYDAFSRFNGVSPHKYRKVRLRR